MTPRRWLVTGGAGFIGAHVVSALVNRGDAVVVLDDLSTGKASALPERRTRLIVGDIRDEALVRAALEGCSGVVHLAARSSVPRSMAEPEAAFSVNAGGAAVLCSAARAQGVLTIVYASSSSVYGDDPVLPRHEARPVAPLSPYAGSKAASEAVFMGWGAAFGLRTVGLRFFNVYGPGQVPGGPYALAVPAFLHAALSATPATVFGDGLDTRDYTYVDDVVAAVLASLSRAAQVSGRVFNIATGHGTSVLALHAASAAAVGRTVPPRHLPARAGDQRASWADVSAARNDLGWCARVMLVDGLARTAAAMSAQPAESSTPK